MKENNKKIIVCPIYASPPELYLNLDKINGTFFYSKCLSNHEHQSKEINDFLSDKIYEKNFECLEHNKEHYIQFCKFCNKNICFNCYEDHLEHKNKLINLNELMPLKNEYNEFAIQLKMMKADINFIEVFLDKINNIKNLINDLNKLLNDIYEKINKIKNDNQIKYIFNKVIYESFNIYRRN